jgi:hypothetical protein
MDAGLIAFKGALQAQKGKKFVPFRLPMYYNGSIYCTIMLIREEV